MPKKRRKMCPEMSGSLGFSWCEPEKDNCAFYVKPYYDPLLKRMVEGNCCRVVNAVANMRVSNYLCGVVESLRED